MRYRNFKNTNFKLFSQLNIDEHSTMTFQPSSLSKQNGKAAFIKNEGTEIEEQGIPI